MTASAGSGKTHHLTENYLELLLDDHYDDQQYRHILAVTFTNKATEEMKSRIIQKLYELSQGKDDRAERARTRLHSLLHDYSCFSVSTIDKFFQTVMRAFAHEIGQYASYRLELDSNEILEQAVDQLIASTAEPGREDLLKWLKEFTFYLADQGMSRDIVHPLTRLAGQFLSEAFLLRRHSQVTKESILGDKDRLRAFLDKNNRIISSFTGEIKRITSEVQALTDRYGVTYASIKSGNSQPMLVFREWAKEKYDAPKADLLRDCVSRFPDPAALSALIEEAITFYEGHARNYFTAVAVRENLYLMGIYHELQEALDRILADNNLVLNALTNDILRRIIADDDTPFLYEKIGNRYDHLMLDEAQDTSRMQWDNFRPLFRNSQASGGCNLIVGDVKQSIYRWRGSDWRLMTDKIRDQFPTGPFHFDPLKQNWRSGEKVVYFNNDFFANIGTLLGRDKERSEQAKAVTAVYKECHQTIPDERKNEPDGYVRVRFLPSAKGDGQKWRQDALANMLTDIQQLREEGYAYKDITILVRRNWEGAQAAEALIQAGIRVITEDSLSIGSAPCISRLMALLEWQVYPDDPLCELQARPVKDALTGKQAGSLYELCEQLLASEAFSHKPGDLPFIYAFLDAVLDYQEKYGSSVRGFVKWWDETGRKKKISAPDGQDAVRVMTVHKAKGLSLDAVIIPFCHEDFTPSFFHIPTIWCEAKGPFAELGLIPVKADSSLRNTLFSDEYEEEKTLQHIDVINLWYVAFTRARTRLLIYAPATASVKKNPSCFENVLFMHLSQQLDGDRQYVTGKRIPRDAKAEETQEAAEVEPSFTRSATTDERLRLSLQGEDYFSTEASARRMGIEEHEKMARVIVDEELERRSGGRHWFDGTYRVLNEASIVTGDGEIYRPDRVLLAPDGSRVIVIDYKFGAPHSAYHRQVRDYVSLMQQMGYPSVEGWLWYVSAGEIVRV